ncbi:MAG: glycoside hydrolase family 2, partial [Candidatus Latescibacteria bacterium]|nr:glycoside hydrolase family 2 [Candidatus Latescibacterota bacterium]
PVHWQKKRTILHFCAADWQTKVWVNGVYQGFHEGGYTPFEFDITDACATAGQVQITVRVYDPNDHRALPGGKQIDWYARTSGIWQTVFLEPRAADHIGNVRITPNVDESLAEFQVTRPAPSLPAGHSDPTHFRIVINAPDGRRITRDSPVIESLIPVVIPDPILWSPDAPLMYEAIVEMMIDDLVLDRVNTSFGMRKISVAPLPGTEINYIHLNDAPIYLMGALNQSFNPWGIYTFPSEEAIQQDLRRTREFGFNFLRLHIKVEEPLFLYWADRMGILLMCDIPNFASDAYGPEAQSHWQDTMRATIDRDYNHPSIFSWCCFNETWGLGGESFKELPDRHEWVRSMYHLTRSLDSTRLVEDNSPCLYDHIETQINSWHFYINDYGAARDHIAEVVEQTYPGSTFNYTGGQKQDDAPLMNSEYGGISAGSGDKDISWCFKYLTNELRLHEKICGYIYTELQDIEWEHNGFLNYDRSVKAFGYDYRMINSLDTVLIDAAPSAVMPGKSLLKLDVYTSHFSSQDMAGTHLRWRVDRLDQWGNEEEGTEIGSIPIPFTKYRVEKTPRLEIPMPAGNSVCTINVWIEDDASHVVARNFVSREIHDGPLPSIDMDQNNLVVRYDASTAEVSDWTGGTLEDGDVAIGVGTGSFLFSVDLPDGLDLSNVTAVEFWAELASGREATPQTDSDTLISTVRISANGQEVGNVTLPNAPADARAVLSYIHGSPGRYGTLSRVVATGDELKRILTVKEDSLTICYNVSVENKPANGLAIFGARAGRYPLQPCVVFRFS